MTELIEKWLDVTEGSAPEEADPVVLECARLLAAGPDQPRLDPGRETALGDAVGPLLLLGQT
ncbi:hypothetical protein ACWCQE_23725, partial [Streptomyces sp. NPDC002409]